MGWVRIDDNFPQHPKVAMAGPLSAYLHLTALCYCNKFLTDGFIPNAIIPTLWPEDGITANGEPVTAEMLIKKLIEVGMWYEEEGGYQIHDYLDFQPSKSAVEKKREAARIRMEKVRDKKSSSQEVREKFARTNGELRENFARSSPYPNPNPNVNNNNKEGEIVQEKFARTQENSINSIGDVIMHYQNNVGIMGPADEQRIVEFEELGMEPALIAQGIDRAVERNKRNSRYIAAILRNWYNDGVTTLDALVSSEQKGKRGKEEKSDINEEYQRMMQENLKAKIESEEKKRRQKGKGGD